MPFREEPSDYSYYLYNNMKEYLKSTIDNSNDINLIEHILRLIEFTEEINIIDKVDLIIEGTLKQLQIQLKG